MKGTVNENVKQLENISNGQVLNNKNNKQPKHPKEKDPTRYIGLQKSGNKMATFRDRLGELDGELKEWYDSILNEILSYKKVKNRISERYNTIRIGHTPLMRISLRKNIIRLYFNLEPANYPKEFYLKDSRSKVAFANHPSLLTVISNRSYQNALTLIEELAGKFNLIAKSM